MLKFIGNKRKQGNIVMNKEQTDIPLRQASRLGQEIAMARKALGKTQSDIAESACVCRRIISGIENGDLSGVSVGNLIRVFRACRMEITARHIVAPDVESVEARRFSPSGFRP